MDQAITSSYPVCSTLEPTACLAGNSDPAHLLSDPEKSNPTEAKICTFVMVTSSIHLILSNPTLLAKLKQMDAMFLKGSPPKIISKFIHFYSMQKSAGSAVQGTSFQWAHFHLAPSIQAKRAGLTQGEQHCPADIALESTSNNQSSISSPQQCHSQNL